jgi:hypothetical protein
MDIRQIPKVKNDFNKAQLPNLKDIPKEKYAHYVRQALTKKNRYYKNCYYGWIEPQKDDQWDDVEQWCQSMVDKNVI